ncbi:bifunctional hydroxymethylpyrimidine kinase/phosphomethylpyrimidine kinase [Aquabacterium sp.]|uniref:bifunctional hydroxymethylpyrimidine kinase/phosphomethylpyrimidine kinase n=1 Tax=Aquabacterium sp. TaxID=1872578 RepID=UPI00248A35EC|nr:bifunctional hydroxymethylpyrimidine kinase/phosphomethylpyrimidine kinase [Aquabacterium sp.]MDI1257988.1 bifunctional hydroxymethylpyrimidine kinase/phosphomethylpyrimidine kinase [Aquabacterium sp.]
MPATTPPPIIWSIAGHDSSGGAGLSADQRAADALGVHLCPVVAAITAQNSQGVQAVFPVDASTLEAQLAALALDLPPRAIKTGLLGTVAAIKAVARWVDHLRAATPPGVDPHRQLALVIDPVLGASAGGAAFADPQVLSAYRKLLIPRATVITPNRVEAARLLAWPQASHDIDQALVPEMARQLQAIGARGVVITGGDAPSTLKAAAAPMAQAVDWLQTPHAAGWLTAPRIDTRHTHGTGCTFASGVAAALALGHVEADAVVLAKMLTHHALSQGHGAGQGAGPVMAGPGFAQGPRHAGAPLPWLGLDEQLPWALQGTRFAPFHAPPEGLYGIVDSAERIKDGVSSGLRLLQLRRKTKDAELAKQLATSLDTCASAQASLFVNDHWREALALNAGADAPLGIHLGQEDLLSLSPPDQALLRQHSARLQLGLSSHSLWELARAAGCGASLIACGPVLPTTTKEMPWQAQGHDNLRWWVAHSPVPVVAIGGLLSPDDVREAANCGPAAVCVVRGLGSTLSQTQAALPAFQNAVLSGRAGLQDGPVPLPHPVL